MSYYYPICLNEKEVKQKSRLAGFGRRGGQICEYTRRFNSSFTFVTSIMTYGIQQALILLHDPE